MAHQASGMSCQCLKPLSESGIGAVVVGGGGNSDLTDDQGVEIRVIVVASSVPNPMKLCSGRLKVDLTAMAAMMNRVIWILEVTILKGFLRYLLIYSTPKTDMVFSPKAAGEIIERFLDSSCCNKGRITRASGQLASSLGAASAWPPRWERVSS